MQTLTQHREISPEGHTWLTQAPDPASDWVGDLADRYRTLRFGDLEVDEPIALDGVVIVETARLTAHLEALIPRRRQERNNFGDVARSDFGETISLAILEEQFGTQFGYLSLRDRELIDQPGRGIDTIGIEETEVEETLLRLVIGETKTSADRCNPPRVVDDSDDSMRNQHLQHIDGLNDQGATYKKIVHAASRSTNERVYAFLLSAAELVSSGQHERLEIVSFCCLARQEDRYDQSDYGSFRERPLDFDPTVIRFVIFCVPGDIENVVTNWVGRARTGP